MSFGVTLAVKERSMSCLTINQSLVLKCVVGAGFALSLKVWGKWDTLFQAMKVWEDWVGSVKVCEFCHLQSTREKLSAHWSETAFLKTYFFLIKIIAVRNCKECTSHQF